MQIARGADAQDIYNRIIQLERRSTMDWYSKDQLLDDLYTLRETIHMLARRHEEIKCQINNFYIKIDLLVDQLI